MGLITGIIRVQLLKMREMDLTDKIQGLTQTQMQLADQGSSLVSISSDLEPDSPEYRMLEARKHKLHVMEKKIEAELTRNQTMLKMVEAEIDSAQQVVDKSIKRACVYGGGGG